MRSIWHLFRQGFAILSRRGKRVLFLYGMGLILLSGLDGIALYFVSQVFTASSGGESIAISSGGTMLVWVIALFGLRTICSTIISWVSVKRFALEEVEIGSSNFDQLMGKTWNERVDQSVTDLYNGIDRGRATHKCSHHFL